MHFAFGDYLITGQPNPLSPLPYKVEPHPSHGRRSLYRKKAGEGNSVLRKHRGGTEKKGAFSRLADGHYLVPRK